MARREIWKLSPETDRALRKAAEAATREIQQTRQRAHHDIQRACEAWAREKYGQSPRARAFAARLHGVAMWTLVSLHTFTLGPVLVALRALQRHLKRVRPSAGDRHEVEIRLVKANVPARLLRQVLATMEQGGRDSYTAKVDHIFSMQDRLATRFFDHRGRLRAKKLPIIPHLRARLVAAFRSPDTVDRRLGTHPQGLSVSAADAYHLTAICLKAAFPRQFRTLTAEGVKQAIAYDRAMQRRRPHERPRYGRV